ncbi:SET domain-containing protein [Hesseltinella vesiculosa]|uniref:SET domain-containing protein n=1 Tax=Hesseltinella vesiculosa TaxID=101127 RepID=A0A1X2GJJ8_9FUNG|nr:SET domain-containing protein [Hesseltinella vesiculosa]
MSIDTLTQNMGHIQLIGLVDNLIDSTDPSPSPESFLQVQPLPNKGRGFVASRPITKGTLIHVAHPFAAVTHQAWKPETCMGCYAFSYPKTMKCKAVATPLEAQCWLASLGSVGALGSQRPDLSSDQKKKKKRSTPLPPASKLQLRHTAFCSDTCKAAHIDRLPGPRDGSGVPFLWYRWLTCMYRLEHSDLIVASSKTSSSVINGPSPSQYDVEDDDELTDLLNSLWDNATQLTLNQDGTDEHDLTMLRLIASCMLQLNHTEETPDVASQQLWDMQDNELTAFRHTYRGPRFVTTNDLLTSTLPDPVQHAMSLYAKLTHAMTADHPHHHMPQPLTNLDHKLFRAIYFREMANGFGLWEQPTSGSSDDNCEEDKVTDDLELLGYGIYPSAVYFNHSCDANVTKVRHGHLMYFYAKQPISKGEEACISYGNVQAPVQERQQRLLYHYHFLCACRRCAQESIDM